MLTQPLAVAAAFSIVLGVTHAPVVVDGLMRWQLGAFALDAAWFGIGVLFWWPVIIRWPHRPWFNPLVQMLYLYFGTKAHLGIAIWLLMAQFPVYATYELTPRVTRLSAIDDQQLAGTIMGTLVEPLVLAAITIVFFRWYRRVESELGPSPPSRAREQIDLSI
jgi:cytochrome c oxidase assembly factor CtaG